LPAEGDDTAIRAFYQLFRKISPPPPSGKCNKRTETAMFLVAKELIGGGHKGARHP